MQNHITEAFALARVDEIARTAATRLTVDEWLPPRRGQVHSIGDLVGRTLVSLGARFLDERSLEEALGGSSPPGQAA